METAGMYCNTRMTQSSTGSRATSLNSYQLKRNVTLNSGTAVPSSAVLWLWAIVPFVVLPVCLLGSGEQGLRYSKGCTEM